MDKIKELIKKNDYYLVTEITSIKTRLNADTPTIDMTMYDNNSNLVESFWGDENDDYNTVYDKLNEKLEAMFPESLYKHEHIERLFEEIREVESTVSERLRNKPVLIESESGEYKVLLKNTSTDNLILKFNPLQSSNIININAITRGYGRDLSRLHSYIHIIEEYLKVPAKERRKELNSIDNFYDFM